jgi:hypothetical protein
MFQLEPSDLLRSKIVKPGFYVLKIKSMGQKPSNNGESINYPVEAEIVCEANGDTTYKGVPVSWMFNSKAMGYVVGFLEAVFPGQKAEANKRYDETMVVGQSVVAAVANGVYNGAPQNQVQHNYMPVPETLQIPS